MSWLEEQERLTRDSITSITALTLLVGGSICLLYSVFFVFSYGMDYFTVFGLGGFFALFALPGGLSLWQNRWYTSTKSDVLASIAFCAWGLLMYVTDVMVYGYFLPLLVYPLIFTWIIIMSLVFLMTSPHPQEDEPPSSEGYRSISELYEGTMD